MSTLGESFDIELEFHHIEKVNVNSGQLIGHKPPSFKTGEEFSLFDIYYIDILELHVLLIFMAHAVAQNDWKNRRMIFDLVGLFNDVKFRSSTYQS
jgi:hypothetical protein